MTVSPTRVRLADWLRRLRDRPFLFGAIGLTVLAGWIVAYETPYGVGLLGDSHAYVSGSENLVLARGIGRLTGAAEFRPLTHYPPFYSLSLAMPQLIGVDKLVGARAINIAAFALLALTSCLALRAATGSDGWGWFGGGLVILSAPLLETFSWGMSDGLFCLLSFAGMALVASFVSRPTWGLILAGGTILSAAWLTRYVGVSLLLTSLAAIWLSSLPRGWKMRGAGTLVLIMLLPMGAWLVRNYVLTSNFANRGLGIHPPALDVFRSWFLIGLPWVVPKPWIQGGVAALVLSIGATVSWLALARLRRRRNPEDGWIGSSGLSRIGSLFLVAYLGTFTFSLTFVDPNTPVEFRTAAPLFLPVWTVLLPLLADTWRSQGRAIRAAVLFYLLIVVGSYLGATPALMGKLRLDGQGYASRFYEISATIRAVRDLPDITLYTNTIPALYFHTGRNAFSIPWKFDPGSEEVRAEYPVELERMRQRVGAGNALIVIFRPESLLPEEASLEDLLEGHSILQTLGDGLIIGPEK